MYIYVHLICNRIFNMTILFDILQLLLRYYSDFGGDRLGLIVKPSDSIDLYTEKCEFGGENSNGVGPELRQFGDKDRVVPFEYKTFVLIDVDDPDDECRHKLTASLKCELGHVELDFGTKAGGSAEDFPHKIKIGNKHRDEWALLKGDSPPAVCAHGGRKSV